LRADKDQEIEEMKTGLKLSAGLALVSLLIGLSGPAFAELEEIVVTAQKREQSLRDVPISVSVFSGEFITDSRIESLTDLKLYAPGLSGEDLGSVTGTYAIRGISSNTFNVGSEPSVGVFIDDIYSGQNTSASAGIFDVERIEVVKGPQGTLFGRNTSAGAVSIISRKPGDTMGGEAQLSVGDSGQLDAFIGIDLPLSDTAKLRIAARRSEGEGDDFNTITKQITDSIETTQGRISLLLDPSDDLRIHLTADYENMDNDGPAYEYLDPFGFFGGPNDPFDGVWASDLYSFESRENRGFMGRAEWSLSDTLTFTSVSGYRDVDVDGAFDVDGTPLFIFDYFLPKDISHFSQDFRLSGSTGNIEWMAGASYYEEDANTKVAVAYNEYNWLYGTVIPADAYGPGIPDAPVTICDGVTDIAFLGVTCSEYVFEPNLVDGESTSVAGYFDVTWHATDAMDVTFGTRYTHDKKKFMLELPPSYSLLAIWQGQYTSIGTATLDGPVEKKDTWNGFQPRLSVNYALSDESSIYAAVGRGYKAGGFAVQNVNQPGFAEETSWSYEVGTKSSIWEGRGLLNAAIFYYDYDDMQVDIQSALPYVTRNAGKVSGRGIEADLTVEPVEGLRLMMAGSVMRAECDDCILLGSDGFPNDASGNPMARSPEVQLSLIANYEFPVSDNLVMNLQGSAAYESEQYFTLFKEENKKSESYTLVGLRAGIRNEADTWSVTLYAKNLFDEEYLIDQQDYIGFGTQNYAGQRKRVGVTLGVRF
jgi:iron complex outermembrane receptor protein